MDPKSNGVSRSENPQLKQNPWSHSGKKMGQNPEMDSKSKVD